MLVIKYDATVLCLSTHLCIDLLHACCTGSFLRLFLLALGVSLLLQLLNELLSPPKRLLPRQPVLVHPFLQLLLTSSQDLPIIEQKSKPKMSHHVLSIIILKHAVSSHLPHESLSCSLLFLPLCLSLLPNTLSLLSDGRHTNIL